MLLALLLALCITQTTLGQAPGGVSSNLRWWMKANTGALNPSATSAADGDAVATWNDQSGIANNATQGTGGNRPIFKSSIINGNPVLRFSSNQFLDATSTPGITGTNSFYFFLVFKQASFVAGGTSDGSGTYIIDRLPANNPLASFKIVNTDKYHFQKRNDSGGVSGPISSTPANTSSFVIVDYFRNYNTALGLIINGGTAVTSSDDNGSLNADRIRIGRHSTNTNGGLNGDLAEVIVYNTNLSATERSKVESYLAIKYGITIDQTTPTDYISSSATIYPASTSHDSYDHDIAGIGRDDASALNQTSSQSQNSNSILNIASPSSLDDGDFLVWGHDSPVIWNSNNTPPGYANRLNRVWRAAETGNVGTVTVNFDLSGLGVDLSDPTKFALLIDSDGNFSDATTHITGRAIVGNTVQFTGADINNNDYFTIATDPIPGPGGVAGAVVWLRADKNVYTDAGSTLAANGQTVQQWNNQGQSAYNVVQSTSGNRPQYVTSAMNFNPVLRFVSSGGTHKFLDFGSMGISSSSDLNFITVVKPTSVANAGAVGDGAGGYIIDRNSGSASSNPLADLKLVTPGKFGVQKRDDSGGGLGGVITTTSVNLTAPQIVGYYRDYGVRYGIYYNGVQEATQTPDSDGPLTLPNLRIGAHYDGDKGLNGDFSELIFYNRDLNATERNLINSYLAIKYGVTLNQSTLTNYTSSSGTVIYPVTTTHSAYKFDIAGIGRDDISKLTQSASRSVNTGSVITVQNPSGLGDQEFLIWGSNNGSMTAPNAVDVDGTTIKRRLSRVWKVAETGDVGTVDITFDLSAVPGNKVQADLRLLIDRDGDGFADNDQTPLTGTLTGSDFTVSGVNFQHNDLITIGTTNITSTPLPVQLVSFDAVYKAPVVETEWTTASELNNDFFTVERSADGEFFEEVGRVDGAGTSQKSINYHFLDTRPLAGVSYYRLRQVDFDGTFSYSQIRKVEIEEILGAPFLSPNPTSGENIGIYFPKPFKGILGVELITVSGVTILNEELKASEEVSELKIHPHTTLSPGVYLVRIATQSRMITQKLVVR